MGKPEAPRNKKRRKKRGLDPPKFEKRKQNALFTYVSIQKAIEQRAGLGELIQKKSKEVFLYSYLQHKAMDYVKNQRVGYNLKSIEEDKRFYLIVAIGKKFTASDLNISIRHLDTMLKCLTDFQMIAKLRDGTKFDPPFYLIGSWKAFRFKAKDHSIISDSRITWEDFGDREIVDCKKQLEVLFEY